MLLASGHLGFAVAGYTSQHVNPAHLNVAAMNVVVHWRGNARCPHHHATLAGRDVDVDGAPGLCGVSKRCVGSRRVEARVQSGGGVITLCAVRGLRSGWELVSVETC